MGWQNTAEKRERILSAAESCLREGGLNRLNIRDVAKKAGVSLGSVHYYFSVKEQILMEVFKQFVNRVSKVIRTRIKGANPREVIIDFVDGFFTELMKDAGTCYIFIDLWGHVTKYEDLQNLLNRYYQKTLDWLTDLIEKGNQQGFFVVDNPEFAAAHVIAIIDGLKVQLHLFESEIDLDRMKATCRNFILNALQSYELGEDE